MIGRWFFWLLLILPVLVVSLEGLWKINHISEISSGEIWAIITTLFIGLIGGLWEWRRRHMKRWPFFILLYEGLYKLDRLHQYSQS